MTLEGVSYTIVGVLRPGFRFLTDADFLFRSVKPTRSCSEIAPHMTSPASGA